MEIDYLKKKFSNSVKFNQNLSKFNWFGVGGNTEILFEVEDKNSLAVFLKKRPQNSKVFPIGAGSNVLIRDKGIKGITILTKKLCNLSIDNNGIITAEAGAMDANVARFARNNGRTGLEFLMGIPGTIGGGIRMNSGAFGTEFKDVLIDVIAINHSGEFKTFQNNELKMGYRQIGIGEDWIFCSARFKSSKGTKIIIEKKMKKIIKLRKDAQPVGVKTGGSTFRNPKNYKAWKLIDQAGCRGLKIGKAMISEKHCNFIINAKNSNATEIEELGEHVRRKVFERSGITLKWEIQRVGIK